MRWCYEHPDNGETYHRGCVPPEHRKIMEIVRLDEVMEPMWCAECGEPIKGAGARGEID